MTAPAAPRIPKVERPFCCAEGRNGTPCRARVVVDAEGKPRRRCRLHGGLSTGPTSAEGKARVSTAQKARWATHRAKRAAGSDGAGTPPEAA